MGSVFHGCTALVPTVHFQSLYKVCISQLSRLEPIFCVSVRCSQGLQLQPRMLSWDICGRLVGLNVLFEGGLGAVFV